MDDVDVRDEMLDIERDADKELIDLSDADRDLDKDSDERDTERDRLEEVVPCCLPFGLRNTRRTQRSLMRR